MFLFSRDVNTLPPNILAKLQSLSTPPSKKKKKKHKHCHEEDDNQQPEQETSELNDHVSPQAPNKDVHGIENE